MMYRYHSSIYIEVWIPYMLSSQSVLLLKGYLSTLGGWVGFYFYFIFIFIFFFVWEEGGGEGGEKLELAQWARPAGDVRLKGPPAASG